MNRRVDSAVPPDSNLSNSEPSRKNLIEPSSISARGLTNNMAICAASSESFISAVSASRQLNNIRSGIRYALLVSAALLFLSNALRAQAPPNPDSALQAIIGNIQGTPLTLGQAKESAAKNATSIRMAESSYRSARGAERRERGAFDPELFFNLSYLDREEPTASFFSGAPVLHTKQTMSHSGLRIDLPIGTNVELALNTVRLETNSDFAFLDPQFDAFGSLNIRQPLLRGFTVSARKRLIQSKQQLAAEKARYDQQIMTTMGDVERAYWDLYAAQYDYAVQIVSRDRAESFLRDTELRAKAGLIGPDQVASARTFLAEQELQLLDREEQMDRQSDQLATLMGVRPETGANRFIPSDDPPRDFEVEPVDILVERALKNNYDLQALGHNVKAVQALADAAGWEAWPSVDLVGSLEGNGLAGTPQAVIFGGDTLITARRGNFTDAIDQAARREFPGWSLGVEVSIPIGLRSGMGDKDRTRANVLSAQQIYVEGARLLEEQVRETYRELAHGEDRLTAANDGVDAAQEQVRIGLIEFQNGRSTAFELVRLAEDLAVAQRRFSEALVRTAKAAVTLRQLTSENSFLTTVQ